MDLKFINSEHFFILAACIKECDLEDEYEELEKHDFNHFNEISEKIIDKFKSGKNEYFSNEVDHAFFYSYRNEENCLDKLFKSKENIILSDNLDDHLKKIIIKDSDNLIERKTRIYVCLGWEVTKTKLIVREEESYGKIRCFNFLPEADEYLWDLIPADLGILRKYPLMGKEYEDWIACEIYTGYKHKMKLLGENEWDDDAEWVKEFVGDINGCYHYEMFDNEDGTNSERDKDLPVLLKF